MKKRLITSLAVVCLLIAIIAFPATAADEESNLTASVTVTDYISITISDSPGDGINFGTLAPGTEGNIDQDADETTPSANVTVELETNTTVDLQISGTDFSGTFTVDNAKYSLTYEGTKVALTTENTTFTTEPIDPGSEVSIWHWLDVPTGTSKGTYQSTFTYKAIPSD